MLADLWPGCRGPGREIGLGEVGQRQILLALHFLQARRRACEGLDAFTAAIERVGRRIGGCYEFYAVFI